MTEAKRSAADLEVLWRRAEQRLRLTDIEPPLSWSRVDAVRKALGPRHPGESLRGWLQRARAGAPVARPAAEVAPLIAFDPTRQRFVPLAGITRLAADSAGTEIELPTRELESSDGRFRLRVEPAGGEVVIMLQALGLASDDFAGKRLGLASAEAPQPFAVIALDEDGDGSVALPDTATLRRALLQPVIGLIETA